MRQYTVAASTCEVLPGALIAATEVLCRMPPRFNVRDTGARHLPCAKGRLTLELSPMHRLQRGPEHRYLKDRLKLQVNVMRDCAALWRHASADSGMDLCVHVLAATTIPQHEWEGHELNPEHGKWQGALACSWAV